MDDELDNFLRERRARVEQDKANLDQDLPYMEIQTKPHRAYGSKENIPPKSTAQGKDESSSVGLPLGVEYERKKQRLQHELRMDYRRYMAQKKQFASGEPGPLLLLDNRRYVKQTQPRDPAAVTPRQRAVTQRDAATLTEEGRGLDRLTGLDRLNGLDSGLDRGLDRGLDSGLDRGLDSGPYGPLRLQEEELSGRPRDNHQESEEEELELMEGRRRANKNDGREKRENLVGVAREGWRVRALAKTEDPEFATGLSIGAADTADVLQRKKQRYRLELQEQIAEQHRNKKREKDLELRVAATGANDPEKQPDRIRQFGPSRRKDQQVLLPLATGESVTSSYRHLHNNQRMSVRDRDTPPPDQPHVAFQSPPLDYCLSPSNHPGPPALQRTVDTPRPLYIPHPPEGYRSSYGENPHYYGNRNLLDPNIPYYTHMPAPGPMSYWNPPPGGAVSSQLGSHSPYSDRSLPEPHIQPHNDDSQVRGFPSDKARLTKERSYREALKLQISEQQEKRRAERLETERYEARLEADMMNHQPWGRGGGGAPLRDHTGNLLADLNQMHKQNEEAYINPEQWQKRVTAVSTTPSPRRTELPDPNERVSGFTHVQTSQFARGNVFGNQTSPQQLQEQDQYKAFLKQQIEDKMRIKTEERERTRLEEEREEKRLAEQRDRIQREYQEEQDRKKRKEMEQKAKNEELIRLAEQRKEEVEQRKREEEERENALLRNRYEKERQARLEEEVHREPSPPIPTLQHKHVPRRYTPRPPTVESRHSTALLSERSLSGLQSPPVPACRNQLRAAGDHHEVFSELSALRRQLRFEQQRLEGRLQHGDWEEPDSPLSDRFGERPQVDVFDMARLRLQAPVRRPNSRHAEPRNLMRIHDSLQLKYPDSDSRLDFSEVPRLEEVGSSSRRRREYRDQYQQLNSRSTVHDDYFDLSPPRQNDYLRSGSARDSLLESDSAFIDPLGEAFPVPQTPEFEKLPQLSARERRRLAKLSQRPQERAATSQYEDYSSDRLQQETESRGEGKGRDRTGRRAKTAGAADLSDGSFSPPGFSLHDDNHQSSIETVATDPWMRPETSDTVKCLERSARRGRYAT